MKNNKKLFKKNEISKEIAEVNKIMDSIKGTNKTIDYITDTLILCNGEVIDKKTFSIMSLPSTKEVLRNL